MAYAVLVAAQTQVPRRRLRRPPRLRLDLAAAREAADGAMESRRVTVEERPPWRERRTTPREVGLDAQRRISTSSTQALIAAPSSAPTIPPAVQYRPPPAVRDQAHAADQRRQRARQASARSETAAARTRACARASGRRARRPSRRRRRPITSSSMPSAVELCPGSRPTSETTSGAEQQQQGLQSAVGQARVLEDVLDVQRDGHEQQSGERRRGSGAGDE